MSYHNVCAQAKHDERDVEQLMAKELASFEGLGHYSMDFAQHFPSNSLQLGPIYFKTPRNVGKGPILSSVYFITFLNTVE